MTTLNLFLLLALTLTIIYIIASLSRQAIVINEEKRIKKHSIYKIWYTTGACVTLHNIKVFKTLDFSDRGKTHIVLEKDKYKLEEILHNELTQLYQITINKVSEGIVSIHRLQPVSMDIVEPISFKNVEFKDKTSGTRVNENIGRPDMEGDEVN